MCFGKTAGMVMEALEGKEVDDVAGLLEYAAQNVTTDTGRRNLRAKRDRGKVLASSSEGLLRDTERLSERLVGCAAGLAKMEARRGARRGSEAHPQLMRGARETLACVASAAAPLQRIEQRGEDCLRYIRESGALIQREWNK
jgi:hypothetical protein